MRVLVRVVEEAYLEAAVVRSEAGGYVRVSRLVPDHDHAAAALVGLEEVASLPFYRFILVPAGGSRGFKCKRAEEGGSEPRE